MNRHNRRASSSRSSRCAIALFISGTTFILLAAVAVAFSLLGFTTDILFGSDDQEAVCSTPSCQHVATALGRSLNSSANPCVDFYQFACGVDAEGDVFETSSSNVLDAARDIVTTFNASNDQKRLLQKAAALYQACEDVRRERRNDAKSLLYFLKQRRLEVILDSDVEPLDAALSLDLRYGLKTLFEMSVLDGLLVVRRREDLDDWVSVKSKMVNHGTYLSYFDHVFRILNVKGRRPPRDLIYSILRTEDLVLSLHSRTTDVDGSSRVFLINATESLVLKRLEWKLHLQKHFERIVISGSAMVKYLDAIFAQSSSASLVLYVVWEVIRQLVPFADHRLVLPDEDYAGTSKRCFAAVMRVMDVPILASVLAEDVTAKSISSAQTLFHRVAESLFATANTSWLRDVTVNIANPQELVASRSLQERFEDIGELRQPFLTAYLRALASVRQQDLESLDSVRADAKSADLLGRDLAYDRQRNVVTVPTSLLRAPFFAEDAPSGVGFGGLGRIIARGLASHLPENRTMIACLRRLAGGDVKNEVIVDAAYLDTLYNAFAKKRQRFSLTESAEKHQQESLFFVAFCHLWCRAENSTPMACNLPLMNSAKFAHAFSCPVGSVMAPALRCSGRNTIPSVLLL